MTGKKGNKGKTSRDVRRETSRPRPKVKENVAAGEPSGSLVKGQRKGKRTAKRPTASQRDKQLAKIPRPDPHGTSLSEQSLSSLDSVPGASGDIAAGNNQVFFNDIQAYNTSFDRFQNGRVYVKMEGRNPMPCEVWFAKHEEVYRQGNHYEINKVKSKKHKYAENVEKWRRLAEAGGEEDVHTMMSLFEELSKYVEAPDGNKWTVTPSVGEFYKRAWEIEEKDGANRRGKEYLVGQFLNGKFLKALEENLQSSYGRIAIRSLISCACQCTFGFGAMREARVAVHPVNESFPVTQVQVDEGLLPDLQGSSTGSGSSYSDDGSRKRAVKALGKGEVYSDILVIEGDEESSKILLVVEVSESDLSGRENQIWLEMLGPLMSQNMVFGLLTNAFKSQLYVMERDDKVQPGKIYVENVTYTLQKNETFDLQNFKHFFIDVMAALEYGKKNIKIVSALK